MLGAQASPPARPTNRPLALLKNHVTIKEKLIVALDVQTVADANTLVANLKEVVGMFKIGSQLFTSVGPKLVESIINAGNKVFLDLKFHDIPHQVAGSARVAAELGVSLFTVHASGGSEMLRSAVDSVADVAARRNSERSRIVAVSVLTSMDGASLKQIGISESPADSVSRLVKLAENSGVDGVVASPQEAAAIRSSAKPGFLIVTPGIRPKSGSSETSDDQKRIATPLSALRAGADYLVIGRPITSATDPVDAAMRIVEEMKAAETIRNN
jgi:orotidine-5'-phosphate decarboxylase